MVALVDQPVVEQSGATARPVMAAHRLRGGLHPDDAQAKMLYDHLTSEKTLMAFSEEYEAGYHCQMGAWAQSFAEKLDWLDETMGANGK